MSEECLRCGGEISDDPDFFDQPISRGAWEVGVRHRECDLRRQWGDFKQILSDTREYNGGSIRHD